MINIFINSLGLVLILPAVNILLFISFYYLFFRAGLVLPSIALDKTMSINQSFFETKAANWYRPALALFGCDRSLEHVQCGHSENISQREKEILDLDEQFKNKAEEITKNLRTKETSFESYVQEEKDKLENRKSELESLEKEITIMHPGPINRGVEITSEVADSDQAIILNQVENGVAIRMAVMYLLASKIK